MKKKRDAQAKAQQAQQQQQEALVKAKVAADMGKGAQGAANAPVGQGSALDMLLGGMGGSGATPGGQ